MMMMVKLNEIDNFLNIPEVLHQFVPMSTVVFVHLLFQQNFPPSKKQKLIIHYCSKNKYNRIMFIKWNQWIV